MAQHDSHDDTKATECMGPNPLPGFGVLCFLTLGLKHLQKLTWCSVAHEHGTVGQSDFVVLQGGIPPKLLFLPSEF